MALRCGIVGLPNVGKSTLFNALSNAGAESANYPFCTIEPNVGVVMVQDARLTRLATLAGSKKTLPAVMEFVDIAGLVAGASKGEGLGNKFLSHIREVDAIVHVVRCFDDDNIVHVEGKVSPADDIEIIDTELLLKDIDSLTKRIQRTAKLAKNDKKVLVEKAFYEKVLEHLNEGRPARSFEVEDSEEPWMRELFLITRKAVLYVANVAEDDLAGGNDHVQVVRDIAEKEGAQLVIVCADVEAQIAELEEAEERAMFLEEMGLEQSGLERLIKKAFTLLGLITYFTVGPKEARAWTITLGTKAPQAAGVIHTDFERGFIRAETIAFPDFDKHQSESAAREAGVMRSEGKEYVVVDGDVMLFRFNV